MKQALEDILSLRGKTRLSDCCVSKTCVPHYDHYKDGELVASCAFQYGVFVGYNAAAEIAEEGLREK